MSGGAFEYMQYRLHDIAERIEEEIETNDVKPEYWWGEWNGQVYTDETINEFKRAIAYLKLAECYAQRVDWLLSGDDGEETFHERLSEELGKLIQEDNTGIVKEILKYEEL